MMKITLNKGLQFSIGLYYYILARILFITKYDAKYMKSIWFGGAEHGYRKIMRPGWKWTVYSYRGNKRLGINQDAKWPVSPRCTVIYPWNIVFDPDNINIFHSYGIYYQGFGKIVIGRGTTIGPNVGLITANHSVKDIDKHEIAHNIVIGENCWIGMNSVILPGVKLGNNTIVGAGSIVTKSFEEGHIVIAGNPAKVIKVT